MDRVINVAYMINPTSFLAHYVILDENLNPATMTQETVEFSKLPELIIYLNKYNKVKRNVVCYAWPSAAEEYIQDLQAQVGPDIKLYTSFEE